LGSARRGARRVRLRRVRSRQRPHRARQADPRGRGDRERRRRDDKAAGASAAHGRNAMKVQKTYFMLMAADVVRGAAFYRTAFGLEPRLWSSQWHVLDHNVGTAALLRG